MTETTGRLSVAWGNFACVIEGVEDPFATMRAVVGYFEEKARAGDDPLGFHAETDGAALRAVLGDEAADMTMEPMPHGLRLLKPAAAPAADEVSADEVSRTAAAAQAAFAADTPAPVRRAAPYPGAWRAGPADGDAPQDAPVPPEGAAGSQAVAWPDAGTGDAPAEPDPDLAAGAADGAEDALPGAAPAALAEDADNEGASAALGEDADSEGASAALGDSGQRGRRGGHAAGRRCRAGRRPGRGRRGGGGACRRARAPRARRGGHPRGRHRGYRRRGGHRRGRSGTGRRRGAGRRSLSPSRAGTGRGGRASGGCVRSGGQRRDRRPLGG